METKYVVVENFLSEDGFILDKLQHGYYADYDQAYNKYCACCNIKGNEQYLDCYDKLVELCKANYVNGSLIGVEPLTKRLVS